MQAKKLTVIELRALITEALSEEHHEESVSMKEDAESSADEEEMRTAAANDEDEIATMSESAQLNRWRKLAGLLKG